MSEILNDFINSGMRGRGVGHFENDEVAASYARPMGSNQRRKFKRHGIVPAAFITYLKRIRAIQKDAWPPERARTIKTLLDLLSDAPDRDRGVYSEGGMLREALLLEMFPELKNKMGSSRHVWEKLERNGKLFGLKGR